MTKQAAVWVELWAMPASLVSTWEAVAAALFSGDNLLELMKSRSMVEKALLTTIKIKSKEQTLAELYISFNKLRKGWDTIQN